MTRAAYLRIWRFENRAKINATNRAWAKRNPGKVRRSQKSWCSRNREHLRAYQNQWIKDHPVARFSHQLKALRPDDSLFDVFVALDAHPGYERHVMVEHDTPLSLLMDKEAA